MSENTKQNLKRNRSFALEARTLFDGSAIFDMALNLDNVDGPDVVASESVSSHVIQSAEAAVSAVESNLLSANRDDIFASFSGGQSQITAEWNSALDQLQSDMADGKVSVALGFLGDSAMEGNAGLFSAEGPDGNPVIYLNQDWIDGGALRSDIESVISEKLGEFVDSRLTPSAREVYFIDASLADVQTLINAVPADAEIFMVGAGVDGFAFMAETLANESGISAIHVLGHGSVGEAQLGSVTLSDSNLDSYSAQLAIIGQSLTADGDILLYGCNVAASGDGEAFIQEIASLTQADIAASDDVTGSGGDWDLEVATGSVEADELDVLDYAGVLGLEYADLSTWTQEGTAGTWVLMEGNRTIFQIRNTTDKYISSTNYVDTILRSTILQTDTTYTINGQSYVTNFAGDNDQIGYVLGYQNSSNYVLIEWRGRDSRTNAGLYLYQYTNGSRTLLDSLVGSGEAWPKETVLNFEILYMNNAVKVAVNGEDKLSYTGTTNQFSQGKIGFYMSSQGGVEYGNVQIAPGSLTPVVPTAQNDTYGTNTNTTLNVDKFSGLLANDYDANLDEFDIKVNGQTLTSDTASTTFNTSHGTVTVYGDGHFTYNPTSGYNGSDTFSYSLVQTNDNAIESSAATVTISTLEPNLAPTDITPDATTFSKDAVADDVVANLSVTDPNVGDSHDILIVSQTTTGMFKVVDGVLKIANPAGITAGTTYSVQLRATDLRGLTYTETLTFTAAEDTDGDGVADSADIDDDNDGILDINESTENFQWATGYSISGNTATGTIGGTGFTYTLLDSNNNALNIQTTTEMFQHSDFPSEYNVPNDNPTIKNTVASKNTLTFDSTILNPVLAFSSIGNPSTPVGINFGDDVQVLWYQKYVNGVATAQTTGYTTNTITATEGDLIVKLVGEYDSITFDYTANETYVNFAFGADIRQDIDTDNDGIVDRLDTDSDGDGVLDNVEAQVAGGYGISDPTTLSGYVAPSGSDVDGDGLYDAYDRDTTGSNKTRATESEGLTPVDTNSNGVSDYLLDEAPVIAVGTLNSHDGTSTDVVIVAPSLTITDVENHYLTQAKVQIDNLKTGDTLSFDNADSNTPAIRGSYDAVAGVLTLTGTATVSDYQAAMRAITFSSTSGDSTDRVFGFTIGSAIPNSDNGHFYEVINVKTDPRAAAYASSNSTSFSSGIEWTVAKSFAETLSMYGMQGYLATITSQAENDFILAKLNTDAWIGASDAETEGTWKWVTGPEAGTTFYVGEDYSGTNYGYQNWNNRTTNVNTGSGASGGEPNQSGNEDAGEFYGTNNGLWNDLPATGTKLSYMIVEYGGMTGDASPVITGTATMLVNNAPVVTTTDSASYTENGSAVALATGLTLTDVDDTNLNSATVIISSGAASGDVLALGDNAGGNITASYNTNTYTLTLTGVATKAQWQTALRSVTYTGGESQPDTAKTISWAVSDASLTSAVATSFLSVTAQNDTPTIDSTNTTTSGALTEADGTNSGTSELNATGVVTISDVDDVDTITLSEIYNNDMVWSGGTITDTQLTQAQKDAIVDGFVVNNATTATRLTINSTTNKATGSWVYSTSEDLNFLAAGETLTFSYNVKATDAAGAVSTAQVVTITITGTAEPMNVNNVSVLESDQYATFVVNNTQSRTLALDLMDKTATAGDGTDLTSGNDDFKRTFEYSLDGGSNWTTYTKAFTTDGDQNVLKVRVDITNDTFPDNGEIFDLNVFDVDASIASAATYDVNYNTIDISDLTLESGTANSVNAVYRADTVFTAANGDQVDALVTISSVSSGVTSFTLDYEGNDSSAAEVKRFQPRFGSSGTDGSAVQFNIAFVAHGTSTAVALNNFYVTGIDVDGNSTFEEYAVLDGVSSYEVEPGGVNAVLTNSTVEFTGTSNTSGLTYGSDLAFKAIYEIPKTDFDITLGINGKQTIRYFSVSMGASEVTFSDQSNKVLSTDALTATATIIEPPAGLKIYNATVNEGAGTITFKVVRDDSEGAASVDYAVTAGTATVGTSPASDVYANSQTDSLTGTINFANGELVQTITLNVTNDTVFEGSETVNVALSNLVDLTLAAATDASAVGTISDDGAGGGATNDDRPAFSVNDVSVNESESTLTFTVTKTGAVATGVTSRVFYSLEDSTATVGEDYVNKSGWLEFTSTQQTQTVTVNLTNDTVYEGVEQFYINLSQASNATIADSQGVATIRDDGTSDGSVAGSDDDRPVFSVDSVTVNEAAGTAVFTVTKTGSTELSSSVDYFTSDISGGATAGTDYTAITSSSPGSLAFTKDETSKTFTVSIANDSNYERSENFQVNLTNASGAVVSSSVGTGLGTIKDDGTGNSSTTGGSGTGSDDDRPEFSINDVTVNEGDCTIVFTVSLNGTTSETATVYYEVVAGTATTADYAANNPQALAGTLTFYAGQAQTQTITLDVTQDDIYELSESFDIKLSSATQSVLSESDSVGTGTIRDDGQGGTATDNDTPALSIADVRVNEFDGTITFVVTRDKASTLATTVDYLVKSGSATLADYSANDPLTGTLTVPAGAAGDSANFTLNITDDLLFERNESLSVTLSNPNHATISDGSAIGTITDDDEPDGAFAITPISVNEASNWAVFDVWTPGGVDLYNLNFAVTNGTTSLSSPAISYQVDGGSWTSGASITNFQGSSSLKVRVDITDEQDLILDTGETFKLKITYGAGASDYVTGTGTIVDDGTGIIFDDTTGEVDNSVTLDDDRTIFTVGDVSISEGGLATFTVTRNMNNNTSLDQTIDFATSIASSDNSETVDFTSTTGTLNFTGGATSQTFTVQTTSDDIYEGDETFTVLLTNNSVGSRLDDNTGVGTIQDGGVSADDDRPTLSINDPSVDEGSMLNFALTLDKATEAPIEVRLSLVDVTTGGVSDYTNLTVSYSDGAISPDSVTGLYTIPAGVTSFTVSVDTTDDTIYEGPETVKLYAYVTDSAITDSDIGTGTITDNGSGPDGNDEGVDKDDDRPSFAVNDVTVSELDGTLTFTVTKTGTTNLSSTVNYSFSNVTTEVGDFTASSGSLTFAAGETQKIVNVTINDDEPWEGTETFKITLASASNAVISDAIGVGSITDQEDRTVKVSGVGPINENSTYAVFEVEAIGGGYEDLSYTVFNGSADLVNVDGKSDPSVSYLANAGTNKFYVGVTIANEDDDFYEGIENFGLKAHYTDDANINDTGYNLIIDDGTGTRFEGGGLNGLNVWPFDLDNDITGQNEGGSPTKDPKVDLGDGPANIQVVVDKGDAFAEVKESLDAYGLADAMETEAQAQIDKLSGKIALYVLPAVAEARSDTVSLFRRLASDDGNAYMGSSVVRSSLAMDTLAPISELVAPVFGEGDELQQGFFGETLTEATLFDSSEDELEKLLAGLENSDVDEHQDFTAQLLAATNIQFGAGIARGSASELNTAEPANINLKDSNS